MNKLHLLLTIMLACTCLGVSAQGSSVELTGTVMSSTKATLAPRVFDNDASTYFTASSSDMQWVGLDLGSQHVITSISYMPASTSAGPDYMVLSVFEGANREDFMDAVPLYLISTAPGKGSYTTVDVNVSRGFRYVRYVGGAGSYCNVAELKFWGYEGEGDDSHFYQVTALPTMSIHVEDGTVPLSKETDLECNSTLIYDNGTLVQEYPMLIHVRGNYSATPENKPYRIKYNDGSSHHMMKGSATNESPVKAKKWVLLNSWRDKTLMRNPVGWIVSNQVKPAFTPWSQPVDLILNGDYRGTYVLADHVDVHKGRIDVTEMDTCDVEGEALTGGYFVEVDNNPQTQDNYFYSTHGNPISIHDPDGDVMQPEQLSYITNTFNSMEDIVFGSSYTDEEKGYRSVLDLESFLKYFLISEFNGNTDMICQVFMYKERGDDHFYTGPVWDHELALDDDSSVYPENEHEEWIYKQRDTGNWMEFVSRILSDPAAMSRLQEMWAELRDDSVFTSTNIGVKVDSLREEMRASANLNFIRWPYLNQYISLTPEIRYSWDAEVDVVRNYVNGRVAWMDKKLNYSELAKTGDVYQLSTCRDLITFSTLVNSGETSASAVLLNDLDMSRYSDRFTPIGTSTSAFCGSFDGGGHTIRNLTVKGSSIAGVIGYAGTGAKVSNLILDSSCQFEATSYAGAFIAYARNGSISVTGCGNKATVTSTGDYAGGVVGYGRILASLALSNCFNVGTVTAGSRAGGLIGWTKGKTNVSNSYNIGTLVSATGTTAFAATDNTLTLSNCYDLADTLATIITLDDAANGKLCYSLNTTAGYKKWRQNLDNGREHDYYPVFSTKSAVVYQKEDGGYTNINTTNSGYRYYKLHISENAGSGVIQVSEFDLLDENLDEVDDMTIYAGTESSIRNENWSNLADNNTGTKYCGGMQNGLDFFFDAQQTIDIYGYRMYTANDTQSNPDRNPRTWALYGSNTKTSNADDSSWELIDEQEGNATMGATNYMPYDFMIEHGLKDLTISKESAYLQPGDTLQLSVTLKPSTTKTTIVWKSTDESVLTVDQTGKVKAISEGTASVIVSAPNYGTIADTCSILVTSELMGYRYYLMAITNTAGNRSAGIQLSEFDILDADGEEVPDLSIYSYTGDHFGSESQDLLVDNKSTTKYCGPFTLDTLYMYFDAGDIVMLTGYRMYTANDTQKYSGRNPTTWCFYGSNNKCTTPGDAAWVLLDQRTDDTTMKARNYTPYDFSVDLQQMIDGVVDIAGKVEPEESGQTGIYDLEGRKLSNGAGSRLHKGRIYIINGKKLLNR